jgi:hypothetical protein
MVKHGLIRFKRFIGENNIEAMKFVFAIDFTFNTPN